MKNVKFYINSIKLQIYVKCLKLVWHLKLILSTYMLTTYKKTIKTNLKYVEKHILTKTNKNVVITSIKQNCVELEVKLLSKNFKHN